MVKNIEMEKRSRSQRKQENRNGEKLKDEMKENRDTTNWNSKWTWKLFDLIWASSQSDL